MNGYIYLTMAILSEVIATTALKASDGFSNNWASVIVVIGYSVSFYCLAIVLKTVPVGIAYAAWSGMGIVLITVLGWLVFKQQIDLAAILGMALIVTGVVVMFLFSESVKVQST